MLQWARWRLKSPAEADQDCLLNRLFRSRSKKASKLRVTGLCAGNSTVTGEFPAQMASNAENVSIWWRHHDNEKHVNFMCYFLNKIGLSGRVSQTMVPTNQYEIHKHFIFSSQNGEPKSHETHSQICLIVREIIIVL